MKSPWLFGSVARDEARPESDVDFVVEFRGAPDLDSFVDLKFFLEDTLGTKVDLVTRAALRRELRPRIENEAILLA